MKRLLLWSPLLALTVVTGLPTKYLGTITCGSPEDRGEVDCNSPKLVPGSNLSTICAGLQISISDVTDTSNLVLFFQHGGCDIPDIYMNFNDPVNVDVIDSIQAVSNGVLKLDSLELPSNLTCGPGFINAVLFSPQNGSYLEYTSIQTEITCPFKVEIEIKADQQPTQALPILLAGTLNPFQTLGIKSAKVVLTGEVDCELQVYAEIQCEQTCPQTFESSLSGQGDPVLLQKSSLFNPATSAIDFDTTMIPLDVAGSCKISVLLDPLELCPDGNRSNNKLEYSVHVNSSTIPKSTCDVFSDYSSKGDNALMVKKQSKCLSNATANPIFYKKGQFNIQPEMNSRSSAYSIVKVHRYSEYGQCGQKCPAIYQNYTQVKTTCPDALFIPIVKFFYLTNAFWLNVTTNSSELQTTLSNIQAVAATNAEISKKLLQNPEFGRFCPWIVKNLLNIVKDFSNRPDENPKEESAEDDSGENVFLSEIFPQRPSHSTGQTGENSSIRPDLLSDPKLLQAISTIQNLLGIQNLPMSQDVLNHLLYQLVQSLTNPMHNTGNIFTSLAPALLSSLIPQTPNGNPGSPDDMTQPQSILNQPTKNLQQNYNTSPKSTGSSSVSFSHDSVNSLIGSMATTRMPNFENQNSDGSQHLKPLEQAGNLLGALLIASTRPPTDGFSSVIPNLQAQHQDGMNGLPNSLLGLFTTTTGTPMDPNIQHHVDMNGNPTSILGALFSTLKPSMDGSEPNGMNNSLMNLLSSSTLHPAGHEDDPDGLHSALLGLLASSSISPIDHSGNDENHGVLSNSLLGMLSGATNMPQNGMSSQGDLLSNMVMSLLASTPSPNPSNGNTGLNNPENLDQLSSSLLGLLSSSSNVPMDVDQILGSINPEPFSSLPSNDVTNALLQLISSTTRLPSDGHSSNGILGDLTNSLVGISGSATNNPEVFSHSDSSKIGIALNDELTTAIQNLIDFSTRSPLNNINNQDQNMNNSHGFSMPNSTFSNPFDQFNNQNIAKPSVSHDGNGSLIDNVKNLTGSMLDLLSSGSPMTNPNQQNSQNDFTNQLWNILTSTLSPSDASNILQHLGPNNPPTDFHNNNPSGVSSSSSNPLLQGQPSSNTDPNSSLFNNLRSSTSGPSSFDSNRDNNIALLGSAQNIVSNNLLSQMTNSNFGSQDQTSHSSYNSSRYYNQSDSYGQNNYLSDSGFFSSTPRASVSVSSSQNLISILSGLSAKPPSGTVKPGIFNLNLNGTTSTNVSNQLNNILNNLQNTYSKAPTPSNPTGFSQPSTPKPNNLILALLTTVKLLLQETSPSPTFAPSTTSLKPIIQTLIAMAQTSTPTITKTTTRTSTMALKVTTTAKKPTINNKSLEGKADGYVDGQNTATQVNVGDKKEHSYGVSFSITSGRRKRSIDGKAIRLLPTTQDNPPRAPDQPVSQKLRRDSNNRLYPYGQWMWGLPDLGLLSGSPKCEISTKNCRSSMTLVDKWYMDCVCPWIWGRKASRCPYGGDLSKNVAFANTIYSKNKLDFPHLESLRKAYSIFSSSFTNGPVATSDIDSFFTSIKHEIESNQGSVPALILLRDFMNQVTREYMQIILSILKELQGLKLFDGQECDWSGHPGNPPTSDELCSAHSGFHTLDLYQCRNKIATEKSPCSSPRSDGIPIIWRKEGGNLRRATYCSVTQQWHWSNIASCGGTGIKKCQACSSFLKNDENNINKKPKGGKPKSEKRPEIQNMPIAQNSEFSFSHMPLNTQLYPGVSSLPEHELNILSLLMSLPGQFENAILPSDKLQSVSNPMIQQGPLQSLTTLNLKLPPIENTINLTHNQKPSQMAPQLDFPNEGSFPSLPDGQQYKPIFAEDPPFLVPNTEQPLSLALQPSAINEVAPILTNNGPKRPEEYNPIIAEDQAFLLPNTDRPSSVALQHLGANELMPNFNNNDQRIPEVESELPHLSPNQIPGVSNHQIPVELPQFTITTGFPDESNLSTGINQGLSSDQLANNLVSSGLQQSSDLPSHLLNVLPGLNNNTPGQHLESLSLSGNNGVEPQNQDLTQSILSILPVLNNSKVEPTSDIPNLLENLQNQEIPKDLMNLMPALPGNNLGFPTSNPSMQQNEQHQNLTSHIMNLLPGNDNPGSQLPDNVGIQQQSQPLPGLNGNNLGTPTDNLPKELSSLIGNTMGSIPNDQESFLGLVGNKTLGLIGMKPSGGNINNQSSDNKGGNNNHSKGKPHGSNEGSKSGSQSSKKDKSDGKQHESKEGSQGGRSKEHSHGSLLGLVGQVANNSKGLLGMKPTGGIMNHKSSENKGGKPSGGHSSNSKGSNVGSHSGGSKEHSHESLLGLVGKVVNKTTGLLGMSQGSNEGINSGGHSGEQSMNQNKSNGTPNGSKEGPHTGSSKEQSNGLVGKVVNKTTGLLDLSATRPSGELLNQKSSESSDGHSASLINENVGHSTESLLGHQGNVSGSVLGTSGSLVPTPEKSNSLLGFVGNIVNASLNTVGLVNNNLLGGSLQGAVQTSATSQTSKSSSSTSVKSTASTTRTNLLGGLFG